MARPGVGVQTTRHLALGRRGQALTASMWNRTVGALNSATDAVVAQHQINGGLPRKASGEPHDFEVLISFETTEVYIDQTLDGQPVTERARGHVVTRRTYLTGDGYLRQYDDRLLVDSFDVVEDP